MNNSTYTINLHSFSTNFHPSPKDSSLYCFESSEQELIMFEGVKITKACYQVDELGLWLQPENKEPIYVWEEFLPDTFIQVQGDYWDNKLN